MPGRLGCAPQGVGGATGPQRWAGVRGAGVFRGGRGQGVPGGTGGTGVGPGRGAPRWEGTGVRVGVGRGRRAGRGARKPSLSLSGRFRGCVPRRGAPHGRVSTWEEKFRKFHPNAPPAHSAFLFLLRPSAETRSDQEGSDDRGCGVAVTGTGSGVGVNPEAEGELRMRTLGARAVGRAAQVSGLRRTGRPTGP